ncbi:monovalent cation/H(+) antiporter subunit G [Archangium lansingense]|uniref:Monovalent cation/H(+) antiporter subunit G n=1 Tax=Archangium lansingense TaxID=2995310 RepID=A0ABT4AHR1_9BACT|nr:monovalent cation/H(+) antiporter subunit G [Archangium lansinium]MCY1081226.1 monovalent cation/H(+) antiporter subunit G [Archangium lansinium]
MRELITAFLLVFGTLGMLLAGLGMVRLPDLFMRMQATAKAATIGLGGLLGGAMVAMWRLNVVALVLLTLIFTFAIIPVAAQLIARAAFRMGVPLWERTRENDLSRKKPFRTRYFID